MQGIKSLLKLLALAVLLASRPAAAAAGEASPSPRVNGVAIPPSHVELALRSALAQGQPDSPGLRNEVANLLVQDELFAQEAVRGGLDKDPAVVTRLGFTRREVLAQAYIQEFLRKNPITDDMIKKEYERQVQQAPARQYGLRTIAVEKEDEAKTLLAQIRKGAAFDKVQADQMKAAGGKPPAEPEWVTVNNVPKPVGDVIVKMKKGQVTDPIPFNGGFLIIRLEDERATKIPPFDNVKQQLQVQMQRVALQKALADLRAKAKVE